MKKSNLKIILTISIVLNLYLVNSINNLQKVNDQNIQIQSDEVVNTQSSISKTSIVKDQKSKNLKNIKDAILDIKKSELDQLKETKVKDDYLNEDDVEKAKEAWKNSASDFFVSEIGLGQHEIDQYFEIDVKREEELSLFMQKRINENGGDGFFYTLEDIVEENKINQKYLNKLIKLLGTDGYENYKRFRNSYNRKIIESGEGFFLIEI